MFPLSGLWIRRYRRNLHLRWGGKLLLQPGHHLVDHRPALFRGLLAELLLDLAAFLAVPPGELLPAFGIQFQAGFLDGCVHFLRDQRSSELFLVTQRFLFFRRKIRPTDEVFLEALALRWREGVQSLFDVVENGIVHSPRELRSFFGRLLGSRRSSGRVRRKGGIRRRLPARRRDQRDSSRAGRK